ncbi:hypothetical protein LBMAG57_10510 [Verrucomicrobiota bacterium]|nr:hypothetical protein LBMAG57_10510 [Verrucomicrobiota bacterium]
MSWTTGIDWTAPAGVALKRLFAELPQDREFQITLFGSSPLQIGLEKSFLSADVDMFSTEEDTEVVRAAVHRAGLDKAEGRLYVEVCVQWNFRTSPRWSERAFRTQVGNVALTLPHPIDILIAKLHRLADKDLAAFRLVIARMGHPTEDEMRRELQIAVDLFRPNFDEEMIGDITTNTRVLWQELWGKDINVRQEIIAPAVALRNKGYLEQMAREPYSDQLRKASES